MSDSDIGRFLSIDPKAYDFPSLSPYIYCDDNPIIKTDPNGDCPLCVVALVAALLYTNFAEAPTTNNSPANRKNEAQNRETLRNVNTSIVTAPFEGFVAIKAYNFLKPTPGYRYTTDGEAAAAQESEQIPNVDAKGEKKDIYFTKDKYNTGKEAKDKLQLPTEPTQRIKFNLKDVKDPSDFSPVKPTDNPQNGGGGGTEATTPNPIPINPKNIQPLPNN